MGLNLRRGQGLAGSARLSGYPVEEGAQSSLYSQSQARFSFEGLFCSGCVWLRTSSPAGLNTRGQISFPWNRELLGQLGKHIETLKVPTQPTRQATARQRCPHAAASQAASLSCQTASETGVLCVFFWRTCYIILPLGIG